MRAGAGGRPAAFLASRPRPAFSVEAPMPIAPFTCWRYLPLVAEAQLKVGEPSLGRCLQTHPWWRSGPLVPSTWLIAPPSPPTAATKCWLQCCWQPLSEMQRIPKLSSWMGKFCQELSHLQNHINFYNEVSPGKQETPNLPLFIPGIESFC